DATHRPYGLNEVRFADVMAFLLLPYNLLKLLFDLVVGSTAAQQRFEIVFGQAEQTRPNLAVGGEANSVAMAAERFTYGRDDPDLPATIRKGPTLCRFG